jgi:glucose-6-phosphate isomerase
VTVVESAAWQALSIHAQAARTWTLRQLFDDDPDRGDRLTAQVGDIYVDFSKQPATDETLRLLSDLADEVNVAPRFARMLSGDHLNVTEDRAVGHVALRMPPSASFIVDGRNVVPDVHDVLARMAKFADQVRSGQWRGSTGSRIRSVVNIGIGGSDLGPSMATAALTAFADRSMTVRFVSNVDGADILEALADLDPASTLVVVSSKTFTTAETMANASAARAWLTTSLGEDSVAQHMVAVSTNAEAVIAFGIDPSAMFGFWDWVGGRYSVDSAIGLSLMIAIGPSAFAEFLAGFRTVDEHMAAEPTLRNVPTIMGLLGVWQRNFLGRATHAVLPYSHYLAAFPAYLQQLDMESNGKSVTLDGGPVAVDTGPIVWGQPGTNGQHAFYQLLHQGTTVVPVDFIGLVNPAAELGDHHDTLAANMFAQAQALAFGRTADEVRAAGVEPRLVAHRTFPGNRPSTTLLVDRLSPSTLGQLIAIYEHKVFVQGTIWGVNSYDQFGVELGKSLALQLLGPVRDGEDVSADSSTRALVRHYRQRRLHVTG